jgi:hypothetical protein
MYGLVSDTGVRLDVGIWSTDENLSDLEREVMDRSFNEEEIKNAIDQIE